MANPSRLDKIQITGNANSGTATKVNVQEANGEVNTQTINTGFNKNIGLNSGDVVGATTLLNQYSTTPVDWTATAFNSGQVVFYAGKQWIAKMATVAGDVPSVSSKWEEITFEALANKTTTVDQTIIDGSTNAVAGNAVFDGLALKSNIGHTHVASQITDLSKASVGLGNVDNTSDLNKPISTATQTALNGKANLSGGNLFTGNQSITGNITASGLATISGNVTGGGFIKTSAPSNNLLLAGGGDIAQKSICNSTSSKGLIIGDSTIGAGGTGLLGIDSYLLEPADVANGSTVFNQAAWVDSINTQLSKYLADSNKNIYDWVIVQLGLNDINLTDNISVAIGKYQNLINQINSNKKTDCLVIVNTMTPARGWWIANYGTTNGNALHAKWQLLNDAIMGGGATPITGVNFRNSAHTSALSDGDGYLANIYDSGDKLHENNLGRELVAASFRRSLASSLNFSVKLNNRFPEYFNNLGSDVYLKGGRLRISTPLGQGGESMIVTNPKNGFNQYSQISYQIENDAKTAKQAFNTGVGNYLNGTQLAEKYFVYWSDMVSNFYSIYEIDKLGNSITRGDSKSKTFSLDNTVFSESSNNGVFNFSAAYKGLFLNSNLGGSNITFQGDGLDYGFISGELESTNNGQVIIRTRRAGSLTNALLISSLGDLNITGKLKAALPTYANDAAADADTTLLSGQFYKLTGSRVVYQKP